MASLASASELVILLLHRSDFAACGHLGKFTSFLVEISREFTSPPFRAADLKDGRFAFTAKWRPAKLWDLNAPGNMETAELCLLEAKKVLDTALPVRFRVYPKPQSRLHPRGRAGRGRRPERMSHRRYGRF